MGIFKWREWVVAALIVGVVMATPGVASADDSPPAASFRAQVEKVSRVTAAVQITKDEPVPARAFTGPFMLADPDNPRVIVAATAELRTRVCYLARSTDAGRTWHILPALPSAGSYPFCTTPNGGVTVTPLAWGRNHTLYYSLVGYNNADGGASRNGNFSVLLSRSTDLGTTWQTTIVDNSRGMTGAAVANDLASTVAVDTSGPRDLVYVGWRQGHPNLTGPAATSSSLVAASSDGGVTFGKPADLNLTSQIKINVAGTDYPLYMGTPFLAVGANGVVEAVSGPGTQSGTTIPGPRPPQPLLAARSTDQGKTWTVSAASPPAVAVRGPAIGWSAKGGAQGTFVVAYQASPGQQAGESNILVERSTDGGQSWANPVKIDDGVVPLNTAFLPQLDIAPNGRVDVTWYDFRLQHGFAPDVFYTHSSDQGATWSPNERVSDRSIDYSIGVSANADLRQPPGVASANQFASFGWADTRLGNELTQTQDVFGSTAQFNPLPANSSSTLPILAAVFLGLVVAGLIMLVLFLSRRRKGQMPPVADDRQPVEAS